jgi:predicted Zn finger-like uncharacterized protein
MSVWRKEMSTITRCPTCSTRFKVTQEQLDAHQGLVRCGHCQAVFNATEYLQDDQSSPQLDLPIAPEIPSQEPVETSLEPVPATGEALDFTLDEPAHPEPQDNDRHNTAHQDKDEPTESITLAQKISFEDSQGAAPAKIVKEKIDWAWISGSVLLLIILLAQTAYFFRVELAAHQPGLKNALISYCRLFRCTVPLPQKADLMSIESSDLEADPAQSGVITLNALLRNHASYTQGYPDLELTLTDAQEKPLARRTFHPVEYLNSGEDEKQGLAANRELGIKLNLDTSDLKPSGYRLFLFYPLQ